MKSKDIYDIIIETLTKEWYSIMIDNMISNPKWETPKETN